MVVIHDVPGDGLATAKRRLAALNRRIARRGLTGRYTLTAERTWVPRGGLLELRYTVRITGTPPRYPGGWRFLGAAEWDEHAGLITRLVPGVDQVDRGALRPGYCDHCRTTRHRKVVYLLAGQDGRQRQVGSTCMRDFLGWHAGSLVPVPPTGDEVAATFSDLAAAPARDPHFDTRQVVALAYAIIATDGRYIPAGEPGSTADKVRRILDRKAQVEDYAAAEHLTGADQVADEIRDYLTSDRFTGVGDFVANLKAAVAAPACSHRTVGLLASAPHVWRRALERDRERGKAPIVEAYVGRVGDKLTVEATVVGVTAYATAYGTQWLYTLVGSPDGQRQRVYRFKWFASRPALGEDPGGTFRVTGKVKTFDLWQGRHSTVLTRCKAERVQAAAPAAA